MLCALQPLKTKEFTELVQPQVRVRAYLLCVVPRHHVWCTAYTTNGWKTGPYAVNTSDLLCLGRVVV
jgi:hypothetical protein